MAVPGTSIASHIQSGADRDIEDYRYMGPEILLFEEFYGGNADNLLVTKESDVYGMGMVVYKASSHYPIFT